MGQLHEVVYLSAMTTYCSIQTTNHKQPIFKSAQIPITYTSSASDFQGNGIPVVKPIRQVPSLRYRDYPFAICLYLGGECGDRTGSGGSCRSRGKSGAVPLLAMGYVWYGVSVFGCAEAREGHCLWKYDCYR